MKAALTKVKQPKTPCERDAALHATGIGYPQGLTGNLLGLTGDARGVTGDCTDVEGSFDACELSEDERRKGVSVASLTSA